MKSMNIIERYKQPTPRLFRRARSIGLALLAAGGTLLAAPVTLPAGLVAVAGYITLAGGVLSAVSQATVEESEIKNQADAIHGD